MRLNRLTRGKTHARKYKDKKPRTLSVRINRVYERARAILRWALAEDIISSDPCAGIKKPVSVEPSRNVVLNETQLKAFWADLDGAPMAPATRIALKLSLVTAQRIGAVASIRNADVHLADERPHWVIPCLRKGRARKVRRHCVPLTPLAVELIEAARAIGGNGEFLFPTTSKGRCSHYLGSRSGMEPLAPKTRPRWNQYSRSPSHRVGTDETARTPACQGLVLGHAPRGVTDIHYDTDDLWAYEPEKRSALEAWSDYLGRAAADDRQLCFDLLKPAA